MEEFFSMFTLYKVVIFERYTKTEKTPLKYVTLHREYFEKTKQTHKEIQNFRTPCRQRN